MTEGRPSHPGGRAAGDGPAGGGPAGDGPSGGGPSGGGRADAVADAPIAGALTEELLRARLHRAVAALEPEPGALPRLRAAVPRRRAVRRRALGGAVVLAAAIAALPVVNVTGPFDLSGDPTGGQAAPGAGSSPVKTPGSHPGHPHSSAAVPPAGATSPGPEASASPSATGSPGVSPTAAPLCARTDLGRGDARQAAADPADGKVYGWFRLTNTGPHACRLAGAGTLVPGAGASGVQVLAHGAGDPADSLPDPAALPTEVLLAPGGSYVVRFAWVPARCPSASESPTAPSGPQQPTAGASGAALPAADTGAAASDIGCQVSHLSVTAARRRGDLLRAR
ncbi:hypothetical protein, partial [Kitasatospora sp. NPDC004272]